MCRVAQDVRAFHDPYVLSKFLKARHCAFYRTAKVCMRPSVVGYQPVTTLVAAAWSLRLRHRQFLYALSPQYTIS